MTDSTDNPSSKPISVAELLAKNGTIGAPPVGGRRRRRRGDTDSISVAELTGEIPIYSDEPVVTGEIPFVDDVPVVNDVEHEFDDDPHPGIDIDHDDDVRHDSVREPTTTNGEPELLPVRRRTTEERTRATKSPPPMTQAEADYAEHVERRRAERELLDFAGPPVRRKMTTTGRIPTVGGGAEQMSPDPAVEAEPSYVRSSGRLFGGQTDDGIQQDRPSLDEIELGDDADQPARAVSASASHQSPLVAGALIVGQCILAVALGAGLFIAFDQLWQWNNVVALVLSVLVILGLVVGVRVVRKTEDIGSTLIAVAVGAMVTLGPLVLLRSH